MRNSDEPVRLPVDRDGLVQCPRRGTISAEWCDGCPRRIHTEGPRYAPEAIVCVPGCDLAPTTSWAPLTEPPDLGQQR